jgi:hypothetical protein
MGRRMHIGYWWGKPEGKIPLGRQRCTWVGNIEMVLREVGWNGMD